MNEFFLFLNGWSRETLAKKKLKLEKKRGFLHLSLVEEGQNTPKHQNNDIELYDELSSKSKCRECVNFFKKNSAHTPESRYFVKHVQNR